MPQPFAAVERLLLQPGVHRLVQLVRRQTGQRVEIDRKRDRHPDAGRREAVMPAELFAERPAHQRREKRADIDPDVEDRIGPIAARVAGRIEPAHLRRHVGLERAVAENEHGQGEQEQRLERHHEVADRHQRRAEQDGAMLAEHTVGEDAAEQGREIDEAGIQTVDMRGERLRAERPEHRFVQAASARRDRSHSRHARAEADISPCRARAARASRNRRSAPTSRSRTGMSARAGGRRGRSRCPSREGLGRQSKGS